jgi:glycerol kinase
MNYGVKVDYTNVVVIENADITVGVAAVLNSNYGEKSITIKNSKLNILGTWTRNNTIKTNYVFEGNNSIDTFSIDTAIDNFKLAGGATLTAPEDITVTTDAGYTVEYAGGKYISKKN